MPGRITNLVKDVLNESSIENRINEEFSKSLFQNIFYKNLELIKNNSDYIEFTKEDWRHNPKQLSFDIYGYVYYDYIIMLINNINSVFDFEPNQFINRLILLPNDKQIFKLLTE